MLASFLPLTHALRALRQTLLAGDSFAVVSHDVYVLAALAADRVVSLACSA